MNPLNIFRRKQPQRPLKASHKPVQRCQCGRYLATYDDAYQAKHAQLVQETFGPDARFRAAEGAEQ